MSSMNQEHSSSEPRPIPALPAAHGLHQVPVQPASPAGYGPAAAPAAAFDTKAFVNAFRRRWPLAIALGLLSAASAGTVTWCVIPPAQYTSYTTLMIATY